MAVRSILVPLDGEPHRADALALAFAAAARFGAGVDALFVRPDPQEAIPVVGEGMSGALIEEMMATAEAEADRRQAAARAQFEAATQADPAVTAQFLREDGREDEAVARRGRLADLLVLPRCPDVPGSLTFDAALMDTGRPLMVCAAEAPSRLPATPLVAWNGGVEATRAVTSALPLLRQAEKVAILTVPCGRTQAADGQALRGYLARHDIQADLVVPDPAGRSVADVVVTTVHDGPYDGLVLGGYGHSRMREMILGGVTRRVLNDCRMPLWMTH